jgi:hypothetical protein
MSCEAVFTQRELEYQESYRAILSLGEQCERYGAPENSRIYMMSRDVEGKWLDLPHHATGTGKPID